MKDKIIGAVRTGDNSVTMTHTEGSGGVWLLTLEEAEGLVRNLILALGHNLSDADPKLDAKFFGRVYKAKDMSLVSADEWCVFLAKDEAFLDALREYTETCRRIGADEVQQRAIEAMGNRVLDWRARHPDRVKVPDAAGEAMLEV